MSRRLAPRYKVVDDNGELTGTVGTELEMTSAEIAERSGILLTTIRRRLSDRGHRRWSRLSESPEKAQARGRRVFAAYNTASCATATDRGKKKRAHEERVRKGNKPV